MALKNPGSQCSTNTSVSYRICMHGGQSGICKFLKGAGSKSHLFIRCVSGFSRGNLKEQGGGGASALPTTSCMKP